MSDQPATPKRFGIFRRKEKILIEPWEKARLEEAAAGLKLLDERRKVERNQRWWKSVFALWPVGVGLVLAALAPSLRVFTDSFGPWVTTLVFPFVVLAERPELQVGPITHFLPAFMLYAQFPIEGLLARIILQRPVLPISVAVQILLFHFLGIVEVWMLSGAALPLLRR